MKKSTGLSLTLIILTFLVSIYFLPALPVMVASHWNAVGEVDGYMSKFWGIFLVPVILLVFFLTMLFIPRIDPLEKNIRKFRSYYDGFILIFVVFMTYLQGLILAVNIGVEFNMTVFLIPAIGVILYYVGVVIEKSKRNWIMGIRTPWTLSSDEVWDKTHKLGGKMFKWTGIIVAAGAFFGEYVSWFILVPTLFTAVFTVVYSYFVFKKVNSSAK